MYDVVLLHAHKEVVLARGLPKDDACSAARVESQRRGVGRMFLAGSDPRPAGDVIVIVESQRSAA